MKITAKKVIKVEGSPDESRTATIVIDFGENLTESTELFGDKVVYSNFVANAKITAQGAIRRMLENGSDQETIETCMAEWKPGQKLERIVDPIANFKTKLAGMDEDSRAELLAELMDM